MLKNIIGVLVVLVLVVVALLYRPTKIEESQSTDWLRYENSELGISFSYPPEWGEFMVGGVPEEDLSKKCPIPKKIINDSYCRLFTNDREYLYESVSIVSNSLELRAVIRGFELKKIYPKADLQSLLDRTPLRQGSAGQAASANVLQKIDTFEKVMLTLEVK